MTNEQRRTDAGHRQPLFAAIPPLVTAVVGIVLFVLPIADVGFWTLDYILFLAFLLAVPVLTIRGKTWAVRAVVVAGALTYVGVGQLREPHLPGTLEVVLLVLGAIVAVIPGDARRIRSLVIAFALAYFGFLQAACPRLPGAIELIFLHLFDENPITMHLIKVGAAVAMGLVFGRYYCGWICPKGVIQEYVYRPGLKIAVPPRVDRALKLGKYVMLGLLILFPLVFHTQLFRYIGPFRVVFNLDGELYAVLFLGVVLATSVFVERAYCRYFCPEGGLLALAQLVSPYRMRLDRSRCTCCRRCYRACPVDAFVVEGKAPVRISRTECIVCGECEAVCRDGSLSFGLAIPVGDGAPASPACTSEEEDEEEGRISA